LDRDARRTTLVWEGKLFVPCLLGCDATGWVVPIALSASDATANIVANPFWPASFGHSKPTLITVPLILVALLGAVFPKDFPRGHRHRGYDGLGVPRAEPCGRRRVSDEIFADPRVLADLQTALFANRGGPFSMLGGASGTVYDVSTDAILWFAGSPVHRRSWAC
jgi:hypothetical protein